MIISEAKKKFENIALISDILNVLLSIITVPIVFTLFHIVKDGDFTYLQSISFNWKSYPITTISNLSFQKGKCGEDESQILFDFWTGTVRGCDCSEQLYVKGNALTRGYCTRRQTGCAAVPAASASPFLFWKSSMFCKNANQGAKTYFDWGIVEKEGACAQGYKSCGKLDSFGNLLCVESKEQCPINYVKYFSFAELNLNSNNKSGGNISGNNSNVSSSYNNSTTAGINYLNNKNYFSSNPILLKDFTGYVVLDDGIIAYSNLFTQNLILVQFKISEGQPCTIPFFDNARAARFYLETNYFQSKCFRTKTNTTNFSFDTRYIYIDSITKYNLYKQNRILKSFDYFKDKTGLKTLIPDFNNNFIVTYPSANAQTSYTILGQNQETTKTNNTNNNDNINKNSVIDNYYVSYLYNFDFSFSHKTDLYSRSFIGLKKKCFDEIKARNLQETMLFHVSKVPIYYAICSDMAYYLVLAAIALASYKLVVYGVFYVLKKTVDQPDAVLYFDKFKFKVLFVLFPLLIEVVAIAIVAYMRSINNTDQTPLEYLNNPECVDTLTYENLSDFYMRTKDLNKLTFGIGFTIGVSLINTIGFVALKVLKVINDN